METPRPYSNPMPLIEHNTSMASERGLGKMKPSGRRASAGSGPCFGGAVPVAIAGMSLEPGTFSSIFLIP